ncbi:DUF883 family protein [Bartonella sp. CB169]|uniref:DUF883 family protein n=1 Tax=Bartonella sp. CB169 TaxID=3112257 RepID=UPI00300E1639
MANNKTTENKETEKNLQGQLEKLRNEISGITSTLTNLGASKLNKAEKMYDSVKENGEEIMSQAKEKISDLEQTMNQCVRKNPCKSVLFAAGAGFILSQLLRR